jgi:hypothetical protein
MSDKEIDEVIIQYVKDNLSPKAIERDYITEKYEELKIFLKGSCFQSGSYARYTAISPVHDLDVIHPVFDITIEEDPGIVLDSVYSLLEEGYQNSKISKIKGINRQSHSITVEFADCENPFSIDVVPAIELADEPLNEFDEPFYRVPEILLLNHTNRQKRYANEESIPWIKTDPRGYKRASKDLNDENPNFRYATIIAKSWRYQCKNVYGDSFKLKSFHLELIFHKYFTDNPDTSLTTAIIDGFGLVLKSTISASI